jgi:Flp pilus assembly protein TadD
MARQDISLAEAQAANNGPGDAQFWFNRAVTLCQAERWKEAEAALANALEIQPELRLVALDNPDFKSLWLSSGRGHPRKNG